MAKTPIPAFLSKTVMGVRHSCLATKGNRMRLTITQRQNTTSSAGA